MTLDEQLPPTPMVPPKAKPAKPQPRSSARKDLNRVEATGTPWWAAVPSVAAICASAIVAPLKLAALTADLLVSLSFLACIGAVGLWWTGHIPDAIVADLLGQVGDRILAILEKGGLL